MHISKIFNLKSKIQEKINKNVSQDVITAIRLKCVCYDSFDDKIQFGTEDFLEVKKASLNIKTTTVKVIY